MSIETTCGVRLRASFKNPPKRRVRARGLQETMRCWHPRRPGPPTGRFSNHALRQLLLALDAIELLRLGEVQWHGDRQKTAGAGVGRDIAPGHRRYQVRGG